MSFCVKINVHSPTVSFPLENMSSEDVVEYRKECPICDQKLYVMTELKNVTSDVFFSKGYCPHCSFSTAVKGPSPKWIELFYNQLWDKGKPNTGENVIPIQYIGPLLKNKNARILDVGCGYGTSLKSFKAAGYKNIFGIEHSKKRADYVKNQLNIPASHCMLEDITEEPFFQSNGPFDAIYLWHVLEHVFDINSTMEKLCEITNEGAALFIAVPHIQIEPTVLLAHFFPHLHAFNAENLLLLLSKYGFHAKKVDVDLKNGVMVSAVRGKKEAVTINKNKQSFYYINKKIVRDLGLFHTLNQGVNVFIHKYIDGLKGFKYGGKNFFIKNSLYFKIIILLFKVCKNKAGRSYFIKLQRLVLLRLILMKLVPMDLITFSIILSIENNNDIQEMIDRFWLGLECDELSKSLLKIEFCYPSLSIPIWGK